jgi:hypothetical protein
MIRWCSQQLREGHDLTSFDCGVAGLNDWLRSQGLRAQQADTARTFVWTELDRLQAVAYYSVSTTQVVRNDLTSAQAGGYSVVPAYLLARLALDRSLQGNGLGSELLVDALGTIVRAADIAAGRLIIVDAMDASAAAFYRRHDFVSIKGNDLRLAMKVATARKALGVTTVQAMSDAQLRLVAVEIRPPDGTTYPAVASFEEVRKIAIRLYEEADAHHGDPGGRVNLREVLVQVLGRDPFAEDT